MRSRIRSLSLGLLLAGAACSVAAIPVVPGESARERILSILRAEDGEIAEAVYELVLLGRDATPVLLEALAGDNAGARQHAARMLGRFGDATVLPALRAALLATDDRLFYAACAPALADIDAGHAADALVESLGRVPIHGGGDARVDVLTELGDPRVVQYLRDVLDDPSLRVRAATRLAQLGDVSSIPRILAIWRSQDPAPWNDEPFLRLMETQDDRVLAEAISILGVEHRGHWEEDAARAWGNDIVAPVLDVARDIATTPSATQAVEAGVSSARDPSHAMASIGRIISGIDVPRDPAHVDLYYEALMAYGPEHYSLVTLLAEALASLGEEGRSRLLTAVRDERLTSSCAHVLASFRDTETVDTLGSLALDPDFPGRRSAFRALVHMVFPHQSRLAPPPALAPWITRLLRDPDAAMRLRTLEFAYHAKLPMHDDVWAALLADPDERVRRGAHVLSQRADISTALRISGAATKPGHAYGETVSLRYALTNEGTRGLTVSLRGHGNPEMKPRGIRIEVTKPDGEYAVYRPVVPYPGPTGFDGTRHIEPGESVSGELDLTHFYRLERPGTYTVGLVYEWMSLGADEGIWAWTGKSESTPTTFEVGAPTEAQIQEMLRAVDVDLDSNRGGVPRGDACRQLSELREPRAIPLFSRVARLDRRSPEGREWGGLRVAAIKALRQYNAPELLPLWMQLSKRNQTALEPLARLDDPRAAPAFRRHAFGSGDGWGSVTAALMLRSIGQPKAFDWLYETGMRWLTSPLESQRNRGATLVHNVYKSSDMIDHGLTHPLVKVRSLALNAADHSPFNPRSTDVLRFFLDDSDAGLQRLAAGYLALHGDPAGEAWLRRDLHAKDYDLRRRARLNLAFLAR
jgi:HEAT repeat protein